MTPVELNNRVTAAIVTAGVAIEGVSIADGANKATWLVTPSSLQAAAQPTIDAFDTSQAAHDVFANDQAKTKAKATYDISPDMAAKIFRALVATLLDEINILRGLIIGVQTLVWDPANMANATGVTSPNITVTGAAFGDFVLVAAPYTVAGVTATAYVSAANTVNIRLHNGTGAAVNLATGTWSVCVRRDVALPARTPAQARTAIRNKVDADV